MAKKFIKCCIPDCDNNEGLIYLDVNHSEIKGIYFCLDHAIEGQALKQQLLQRKELEVLGINLNYVVTTAESKPKKSNVPDKLIESVPEWEWVDDNNRWMDASGKIQKISKLTDKELEDAVIQIQETNIKRVTQRISWITKLKEITSRTKYVYPQEKLKQNQEEAYAKLEEFYEVMVEKGLIPS